MFITLEGIEGSGKTTQSSRLKEWFENQGKEVVITKEPGGTPFGLEIRQWLLDPQTVFKHPKTELLLFIADRLEHVEGVIKPALEEGKVVICDRFVDSTIAYQQAGRGLNEDLIATLNSLNTLMPNHTFVCDLPVKEGLKRAKKRAELDRFEQEDVQFHERIRQAFLSIAKQEPQRVTVVSCDQQSPEEVFQQIIQRLKEKP